LAGRQSSKAPTPVPEGAAVDAGVNRHQNIGSGRFSEDITLQQTQDVMNDASLSTAQKNLKIADIKGEGSTVLAQGAVKASTFGFLHKFQPEVRLMLNKNPVMRRLANKLLLQPFRTGKNEIPLESYARVGISTLEYRIPRIFKKGYAKYSKDFADPNMGYSGIKMTLKEFDHAVRIAMTKSADSTVPAAVADTASRLGKYTDDYAKRAVDAEMMDANVVPLVNFWVSESNSSSFA
jgi:hypothetical protein